MPPELKVYVSPGCTVEEVTDPAKAGSGISNAIKTKDFILIPYYWLVALTDAEPPGARPTAADVPTLPLVEDEDMVDALAFGPDAVAEALALFVPVPPTPTLATPATPGKLSPRDVPVLPVTTAMPGCPLFAEIEPAVATTGAATKAAAPKSNASCLNTFPSNFAGTSGSFRPPEHSN
jgi:hypothetical protein